MKAMMLIPALGLAGACADRPDTASAGAPAAPRRWVEAVADTLWTRGGMADTVLELPYALAADGRHVYVTDLGSRRVAALHAEDGTTAWIAGGRGGGPGEFERPAAIALLPDERLAVSDTRQGRVVVLGRDGRHDATFPVEDPEMNALCGLRDGSLVATAAVAGPPVTRWTGGGQLAARTELPWPELAGQSALARQTLLAPLPDGSGCIVALALGRGFARFDGERFGAATDYIEAVATPRVEERVQSDGNTRTRSSRLLDPVVATRSLAATSERILITFDGASADRGRILDVYDADGTYRHSHRLDRTVHGLAYAAGRLFVLSRPDDVPTLIALRWADAPAAAGEERSP